MVYDGCCQFNYCYFIFVLCGVGSQFQINSFGIDNYD